MDEWMDYGWMDGQMDKRVDGWMFEQMGIWMTDR